MARLTDEEIEQIARRIAAETGTAAALPATIFSPLGRVTRLSLARFT